MLYVSYLMFIIMNYNELMFIIMNYNDLMFIIMSFELQVRNLSLELGI